MTSPQVKHRHLLFLQIKSSALIIIGVNIFSLHQMESIFVHTLRSSEMNEMMMQHTKAYKDLKCSPDIESHYLFNNVKLRHGQPRLII